MGLTNLARLGNRQPTGAGSPRIRIVFNSNSGFYTLSEFQMFRIIQSVTPALD